MRELTGQRTVATAIAMSSLLISLIFIWKPSFWYDEAASISAASMPWSGFWKLIGNVDGVHGLYYALLHPWIAVSGISETWTRLPSALALSVAAYIFTRLAQSICTAETATIAGIAFVVLPGIAWSGNEARDYALLLLTTVIATRLHTSWAQQHDGRFGLIGYSIAMTIACYFSVLSILLLIVHLAIVLLWARERLARFLCAGGVVLVLCSPVFIVALGQRSQLDWISLTPVRLAAKVALGQYFLGPRDTTGVSISLVCGVFLLAVFIVGLVVAIRTGSTERPVVLGILWAGIPTVLLAGAALVGFRVYQERYLVFSAPGVLLILAFAVSRLRARAAVIGATILIVALCIPVLVSQKTVASKAGDDYRKLAEEAADSDTVLFQTPSARGVAIAYPALLGRADDILLAQSPARSGTLWGINRKSISERELSSLRGRVTLISKPDDSRSHLAQELNQQCKSTDTVVTTRWRATSWDC